MKFFIDTANIEEIKKAWALGVIDGVTTNPSLISVVEAAKMGAHIATIPYSVIIQLIKHPLTDIGIERFLKDWEKVPKEIMNISNPPQSPFSKGGLRGIW